MLKLYALNYHKAKNITTVLKRKQPQSRKLPQKRLKSHTEKQKLSQEKKKKFVMRVQMEANK